MAYTAPDYGNYTRQKADIDYDHGNQSTQNAYGRFLGQQRFERGVGDADRQFKRQYTPYKASFGQRGLSGGGINSGAMKESMGRFVGDYGRDVQRAHQDQTLTNQNYDMQQAQLDQWRERAMQDVDTQKANDIAWTAQNLTALREMLGGM
ncbi:MAG TPA: hypothetical protein VMW08_08940 [Acidimicrobiales bacterium]|nr:hypothetical protein [Acidimicrobiales bacterium]